MCAGLNLHSNKGIAGEMGAPKTAVFCDCGLCFKVFSRCSTICLPMMRAKALGGAFRKRLWLNRKSLI